MKRNHYAEEYLKSRKFNNLTFITFETPIHGGERRCQWKCDCGKSLAIDLYSVTSGRTKSCGCIKKTKTKQKNGNWKGIGDMPGDQWKKIRWCAKSRDLDLTITKEDVWNLFLQQGRKCALTGQLIWFDTKYNLSDGTASLDRIDSSKGYIKGNVQWVHKDINRMKNNFSDTHFISLCKMVAQAHQ